MDDITKVLDGHHGEATSDLQNLSAAFSAIGELVRNTPKPTTKDFVALWSAVTHARSMESETEVNLKKYIKKNKELHSTVKNIQETLILSERRHRQYEHTLMTESLKHMKCNPHWDTSTSVSNVEMGHRFIVSLKLSPRSFLPVHLSLKRTSTMSET